MLPPGATPAPCPVAPFRAGLADDKHSSITKKDKESMRPVHRRSASLSSAAQQAASRRYAEIGNWKNNNR